MKSQTDLIVSIVAVLLALIMAGVFLGTNRDPQRPPPPEVVTVTPPAYPAGSVVFANAIPGAGSTRQSGAVAGRAPGGAPQTGGMSAAVAGASDVGGGSEMQQRPGMVGR